MYVIIIIENEREVHIMKEQIIEIIQDMLNNGYGGIKRTAEEWYNLYGCLGLDHWENARKKFFEFKGIL